MSDRIERHRQMAEAQLKMHQALTAAHVAGGKPIVREHYVVAPGAVFYVSGVGESVLKEGEGFGAKGGVLNELKMYWQKIPDFGVKRYAIYPAEDGWLQFLYWEGTDVDGKKRSVEEADRMITDAQFRVTRAEALVDLKSWSAIAAYVNGRDPATWTPKDYYEAMDRMARSD